MPIADWRKRLDVFLADFEHKNITIGVLVCGSYITGSVSEHSDLDVHIILDEAVNFRERGNRIIDGLLIEYFANPPRQILRYFQDDLKDKSLMCQTQFATGEILMDKTGAVAELKTRAKAEMGGFYASAPAPAMSELTKYGIWDMLDDLEDAHKANRADFDFLYHNNLGKLINTYMGCINMPYNTKTIMGNINSDVTRKKYLLRELPDDEIAGLIKESITTGDIVPFRQLANAILNNFGGFDITTFTLKTDAQNPR